jgi:DNA-binding LacI/PurR family transcriptional regulator
MSAPDQPDGVAERRRRATIDDVAALAAVSRQTVSNVVNGKGRLGPETRRLVEEAISTLDYQPHRAARGLRARRSFQLAHPMAFDEVLPDNLLMVEFVQGLVAAAGARSYHLLLTAAASVTSIRELVRSGSVDAFVLANLAVDDPRVQLLAARGIPFSCFGRTGPGLPQAWVDIDNRAAVCEVVAHLVARGHRRLAYLGYETGNYWDIERVAGYRAGMAAAGLRVVESRVMAADRNHPEVAVNALLDGGRRTTAIVTGSDTLAALVCAAAPARHLVIGEDVAVTGFDGSSIGRMLSPHLTTMVIPTTEIAERVVARVLRELDGPTTEPGEMVAARLVVGDSTGEGGDAPGGPAPALHEPDRR